MQRVEHQLECAVQSPGFFRRELAVREEAIARHCPAQRIEFPKTYADSRLQKLIYDNFVSYLSRVPKASHGRGDPAQAGHDHRLGVLVSGLLMTRVVVRVMIFEAERAD